MKGQLEQSSLQGKKGSKVLCHKEKENFSRPDKFHFCENRDSEKHTNISSKFFLAQFPWPSFKQKKKNKKKGTLSWVLLSFDLSIDFFLNQIKD